MAFTIASDTPASVAQSPSMVRRLLSAIMRAREAQAQRRLTSQLRDLHSDVLKDIGLENSDIRKLSGANTRTMFHLG